MSDAGEGASNWTSFPALAEEVDEPVGLAEKLLGFFTAAVAPAPPASNQNPANSKASSAREASVRAASDHLGDTGVTAEEGDQGGEFA